MKVGYGVDFHRLVKGRKLILGGIDIDYPLGLEGHSDADVIIHAISDAILGGAGLGDIGKYFPETPEYKDISSIEILKRVNRMLPGDASINHIDLTFIGEEPKIAPCAEEMKGKIANALGIRGEMVNIKATTTEGLGAVGEKKGLGCQAVVTLEVGKK
ncbi:MAG: 2-C-methyl-D-erythritol 2,4-cyclodiphosphate synthase [Candidatus Omnitrophica bacterium]|nr:2-C-methyl-D-erythritol 2,4-cyclodiphosphate synthase [Candidatus Omnitrophota bacterium]